MTGKIFKDIFNVGSEGVFRVIRVLYHRDTIIYVASGVESIYLVQSEGETARAASKESRHPLRKFSQLCAEIAVRRETWSYVFAPQCMSYVKILTKSSSFEHVARLVFSCIHEIIKISLKYTRDFQRNKYHVHIK